MPSCLIGPSRIKMSKALLPLALALARPAASQLTALGDGATDVASLDPNALVPAPDSLLERVPISPHEVQKAVRVAFVEDLKILQRNMQYVLRERGDGGSGALFKVRQWIRDSVGKDRHIDEAPRQDIKDAFAEVVDIVMRYRHGPRGSYPLFMKPRISRACALYVRELIGFRDWGRCVPVACPSLESARACAQLMRGPRRRYYWRGYAKIFDVLEVSEDGVQEVGATGRSGATNWAPITHNRVFIKSANLAEAKVAEDMQQTGMWRLSKSLLLMPYVGLRWMVPTGHKVRARPRGGVARNRV